MRFIWNINKSHQSLKFMKEEKSLKFSITHGETSPFYSYLSVFLRWRITFFFFSVFSGDTKSDTITIWLALFLAYLNFWLLSVFDALFRDWVYYFFVFSISSFLLDVPWSLWVGNFYKNCYSSCSCLRTLFNFIFLWYIFGVLRGLNKLKFKGAHNLLHVRVLKILESLNSLEVVENVLESLLFLIASPILL